MDNALQLAFAGCSDAHAQTIVTEDFELFDIIIGLAGHYGMDAAGIVADHAAQGAVIVRGRIGTERQVIFFRAITQIIEHDAGLDPSAL